LFSVSRWDEPAGQARAVAAGELDRLSGQVEGVETVVFDPTARVEHLLREEPSNDERDAGEG
jgi:hypothetical protein